MASYVFPIQLPAWVEQIELPFFLYDIDRFRERIASIYAAFGTYNYPIKANPHSAFIDAVLEYDGQFDVCSIQELTMAMEAGVKKEKISFCSVNLTPEVIDRLSELEVPVTLNCVSDLKVWMQKRRSNPICLRLEPKYPRNLYRSKFGFSSDQLYNLIVELRGLPLPLCGLHFHTSHDLGPKPFVENLETVLEAAKVLREFIPDMSVLNLGGGWPVSYGQEAPTTLPAQYKRIIDEDLMPSLVDLGFRGEIRVEPGEYTLEPCGFWGARISAVKESTDGTFIIILDTQSVVSKSSEEYAYPVSLLRRTEDGLKFSSKHDLVRMTIFGATNSPFDAIRKSVWLPRPNIGDILVFGQIAAYLPTLMSPFNLIPPPRSYIVDNGFILQRI